MKEKFFLTVVSVLMGIGSSAYATTEGHDLGQIVVTATRIAQPDNKITSQVTVIDQNDIESSTAQTIPDILKEALGVNIFDNSSIKTSKIDMRGFGETAVSNVLILVNDRKTNSIDMSGADLIQIPLSAVKQIEIIRGAGSVLYGDNAVGGVINIITKEGSGELNGMIGTRYGSYDRRGTDVEVSGEKNNVSYYLYSNYDDSRGFRQNSDVLAKDWNARLGYRFSEKLAVDLETNWHEDHYGQPGSLTQADLDAHGRRHSSNEQDAADTRDRFINLSFDLNPWPEDLDFGNLVVDVNYRNRDSYSDNVAWSSDTKNMIDTMGVTTKYVFDKTIFDHDVNFVTGVDYYDHENEIIRESGGTTHLTISKKEFGVYGFAEYEIVKDWFVNTGTRFQKAAYNFNVQNGTADKAKDPDEWVSMGGVRWNYAPGSNVFANVQQTFRFLATDEWFNTISGVLNTDLSQQTGIQYEVGVKHNFDDTITVSLTPYLIDIDNEIYYNPTGGNFGWGANENYDKTRRLGVETGASIDLLQFFDAAFFNRLELFTNYTYQHPEFRNGEYDGNDIPMVPRHQISGGIRSRIFDRIDLSLTGRYVGSRYVGSDTANALNREPSYCVADVRVAYVQKDLEVFGEINNLFDEQYNSYVSSYSTTKYFYPAEEMNFNVGMKVKF